MNKQSQQKLIKFWKGHAHSDIFSGYVLIIMGLTLFIFSLSKNSLTPNIVLIFALSNIFGSLFIASGKKKLEMVRN